MRVASMDGHPLEESEFEPLPAAICPSKNEVFGDAPQKVYAFILLSF